MKERIVVLLLENFCRCGIQLKQIQAQLIVQNLYSHPTVAYHFIAACQSHRLLNSALLLFTTFLPHPNVFIFNNLIRAFSSSRIPHTPLSIYSHMCRNSVLPNSFTFPLLLKGLSLSPHYPQALSLHSHILKLGHLYHPHVQNSLLSLYSYCAPLSLCRQLFDEMPHPDVVSWSVLITAYRNAGRYGDALGVFQQMQCAGVVPNRITVINALGACSEAGAVEIGVWIHDLARREGWDLDVVLGTALIEMYTKCGRVEEGLRVFYGMERKNVFTWNAVIKGLALAKSGDEAICWFDTMQRDGVTVDEVTLLAVLSACNHSGLVDKGREIFGLLVSGKYGFYPNVKHFACMVDMFARSGRLQEAFEFMKDMPFEPTKTMWGSLLVNSKSQSDLEIGELAARKLVELEPDNPAYCVHLSNLYAEMGRWSDVEKVRRMMKDNQLNKELGSSFVEVERQGAI